MSPLANYNSSSNFTGNMGLLFDQASKFEHLKIAVICLGCGLIVMIIVFVVCKIRTSRQKQKAAEEMKINAAKKRLAGNKGIDNKMDNIENKKSRTTSPLARSKQRVDDIGRSDNVRKSQKDGDGRNQQPIEESSRKGPHKSQLSDSSNGNMDRKKIIQRKISSHNNDIEEIPLTPLA